MASIDRSTARHNVSIHDIVDALNAGHPALAYDACRALLAQAPDDPALNQLGATAALRTEHFEEAWHLAQRSLAARADHVQTLILAGRAARGLARHGDAVAALSRAVAQAPGNPEPAFALCLARLDAGAAPDALGLERLAADFPREHAGWDEIVRLLLAKGFREAALFCLSALGRAAPSFAVSMRRGLLAKELGRGDEARRAFEEAVKMEPDSTRAWFLLGVASQDLRDHATAEHAYRRTLTLEPTVAEAAVNLGTLLQEDGDLDGAKIFYAQAVKARADTFGRVAQAITTSPKGELWLDLRDLRRRLEA